MNIGILGAGMSGISLAYLLQEYEEINRIELLEETERPGGLCCSYDFADISCDIGPHVLFSKNATALDLLVSMLGDNVQTLRRSNRIYHNGRFIKYPFENELSALSAAERDYCLHTFLNNPYSSYPTQNMLQFFLATFGEGITNLYLRPYNEKIWKFDPVFLDTQMVERIPKPPPEDIIKSAKGIASEGYLHQLYFYYPKRGGLQALVNGFLKKLGSKVVFHLNSKVHKITRSDDGWQIRANNCSDWTCDRLVSTIPIPELLRGLNPSAPQQVLEAAQDLKFNSIAICLFHVTSDHLGQNLSIMVADKQILFHRLSKLDFLLTEDARDGSSRLMAEVTYRQGDQVSRMNDQDLINQVLEDLVRLGFIKSLEVVRAWNVIRRKHAYVIYDLDHRRNMRTVRDYCEGELGLILHGRFGEFEYLNIDGVVERSMKRAHEILGSLT